MVHSLKALRNEADVTLADIKRKILGIRQHERILEKITKDTEGISSKEDISIRESERRKEYFSIVRPTETLPRSTMDGEQPEVRKHV